MADRSDSAEDSSLSGGAAAATGAAAAAAGVGDDNNISGDANLIARRLHAVDQLTNVFGFDASVAEQAVDAVGFADINLCYNYILDQGAEDKGGPVTPIETCPHIAHHVKLSQGQLPIAPHATVCQHNVVAANTNAASGVGRPKSDLQEDGNCPGTENWLCLECGTIRCSRYVNGHGLAHWEETKESDNNNDGHGHCVAVSLADLSVWCYVCNAYLRHPSLSAITYKLEQLKFSDDDEPGMDSSSPATAKEPERKKPRQENDMDEDDEDSEDDDSNGSPARGVELNLDVTGEEDDEELFRMIAAAASAQGIPLQWILSSQGHGYGGDDDEPIEYPFEQLPKSLSDLADFIQSDQCKRILILAGAGMSVASGIPDFRSADGLYATMNADTLTCTDSMQREAIRADPSTALDQHLFMANPLPCLESQREFILGTRAQRWKATLAHRFVELLHAKTNKLVRLYTQNIDGLEDQCTQLPEEKVINVHGSMDRAACATCLARMDFGHFSTQVQAQIKDVTGKDLAAPKESTPITCLTCGQPTVKPAIVLFRSSLPKQFFENVPTDVKDVDLLLIFGTSLKVAPANSLVWRVPKSAMRVLVNRETAGEHLGLDLEEDDEDSHDDANADRVKIDNENIDRDAELNDSNQQDDAAVSEAAAAIARSVKKPRDYFAEGDCDKVLLDLMIALGWLDDLKPLVLNHALPASSTALLNTRLEQSQLKSDDKSNDDQKPAAAPAAATTTT